MKLDCFFLSADIATWPIGRHAGQIFVDPEIVLDENARDIGEIILSYPFFRHLEAILLRVAL